MRPLHTAPMVLDMRVLVCGWLGSTNLGDELVFQGVRQLLAQNSRPPVRIVAVSLDPRQTRRVHDVEAIDHRRIDRLICTARQADLVVLGGGGLLQDETSAFNLPYHLLRVVAAEAARTPWVGIGLGVGPVDTAAGRRQLQILSRARALTVRDTPSASLLASLGIASRVGTDAAWHVGRPRTAMPSPRPDNEGHLLVSLRPWATARGHLPVAWRRQQPRPAWFVPTVADALDRAVTRSGILVRFLALQTDRDAQLHAEIAARMRTPTTQAAPALPALLDELARARLVVAMRYHAGVGATMGGRPSVLVGYSSKVRALASELGTGTRLLRFAPEELESLGERILDLLADPDATAAVQRARDRLLARTAVDRAAVTALLG